MNLVCGNRCKERPNGLCNINPLQSSYLAAAYIAKMILIVVWRQRAGFFLVYCHWRTFIYIKLLFLDIINTVLNWWNCYLLEIYGREWTAFNNWSPRLSLYLKRQIITRQDSTVAIMGSRRSPSLQVHLGHAPCVHRACLKPWRSASRRLCLLRMQELYISRVIVDGDNWVLKGKTKDCC